MPLCRQFFYVLSKAEGRRLHLSIAFTSAHSIAHSNSDSASYSFAHSHSHSTISNAHADTTSNTDTFAHPLTNALAISITFMQRW